MKGYCELVVDVWDVDIGYRFVMTDLCVSFWFFSSVRIYILSLSLVLPILFSAF